MSKKPEKPETRKATKAANGINQKLRALAAEIDDVKARFFELSALADRDCAFMKILEAEAKLDKMAAVNLDELRLKARHRWGFPWPAFCCPDGLPLSYAYPPNLGPAPRRAAGHGARPVPAAAAAKPKSQPARTKRDGQ